MIQQNLSSPFEEAFKSYFSGTQKEKIDHTGDIAKSNDKTYTYHSDENIRAHVEQQGFVSDVSHLTADDNVDSLEQLCNIIKPLLNAAWGTGWGEFSPDLKRGEKSGNIVVPQITAEVNERDCADKMPLKPVLTNTVKEIVNGIETGDSLLIYRQWFDCNIEFDFYGRTSKEVRDLQNKFETLIQVYAGYLKRHGVAEILFLREMSARNSLNFTEQTPMRCLVFYVRFERIIPVRRSLINKINASVGIKEITNESINTTIERNQSITVMNENSEINDLDFIFQSGNTGVDYSDI